jgi:hypothetical protein
MERHLLALGMGLIGGLIPNTKSNIHPFLMGAILALLTTKVVFGDYDTGYQWSLSDIVFLIVVGGEGVLGAFLSSRFF